MIGKKGFKKGGTSWNKGLTKETSPIVFKMAMGKVGAKNVMKRPEVLLKSSQSHLGIKHTKEAREKISQTMIERKNHLWKGGITKLEKQIRNSFKYRQWKSDVFTRDDFTCQKSHIKGGYLNAHHIKPFSQILKENKITTFQQAIDCEELWNLNNGITLSKAMHNKEHFHKF